MRLHGRIAVVGMISQYNHDQPEGIRNLLSVVYKRIHREGFIVYDSYHLLWPIWMLKKGGGVE